jgi:hypothetical protein
VGRRTDAFATIAIAAECLLMAALSGELQAPRMDDSGALPGPLRRQELRACGLLLSMPSSHDDGATGRAQGIVVSPDSP